MIKEAVSPLEPRYEDLAGDGFGRKARRLFLATRPKFLTASVLPVLVGTAWGATVAGGLDFGGRAAGAARHRARALREQRDQRRGRRHHRHRPRQRRPHLSRTRAARASSRTASCPCGEMHRWAWMLFGMAAVLGLVLALLKGPMVVALGIARHRDRRAVFHARSAAERQGRRRVLPHDRLRRAAGVRRRLAAELRSSTSAAC